VALSLLAGLLYAAQLATLYDSGHSDAAGDSLTGAFVALGLALQRLVDAGTLTSAPVKDFVAAISVGIVDGEVFVRSRAQFMALPMAAPRSNPLRTAPLSAASVRTVTVRVRLGSGSFFRPSNR
jgi:hypothetical protein